jgi:hypothetical protein
VGFREGGRESETLKEPETKTESQEGKQRDRGGRRREVERRGRQ